MFFKRALYPVALLALGLVMPPAPARAQEKPDAAREEQAFTIGQQAYIYGLPLVNMYLKRQEHLAYAKVNEFRHLRDVVTPEMGLVAPNVDVLYSLAWLDLRDGPVVLTVPETHGRYYSIQTVDFYAENGFYISKRTSAEKARTLALVGPDWRGKLPSGMQRLDCRTPAVGLVGRTLVTGASDLPKARALQSGFQLERLPGAAPQNSPIRYPKFKLDDPLEFFAVMDEALRQNPPLPSVAADIEPFRQIGIGTGTPFRVKTLDPATRAGLTRAVAAGRQRVDELAQKQQQTHRGWIVPPSELGQYGTNYLLRAAAASLRLGIHSPREVFYLTATFDRDDQTLRGDQRYVLRFSKDQLPPVHEFWSVTLYRMPERKLAAHAGGRPSLQSLDKTLRWNADGGLEIYLQAESPGPDKAANWLATPPGEFRVVLRLYDPLRQVSRDGWIPPALERLSTP